ncbi:hypothetical protein [Roseibium sediminicola]|uniref:Uncharacterized protein n=1 Tax=Roseibium sediminicola TaxID=2933272 RepID=A0ABT0GTK9_9HYPH|nr:hypothetical protein [Roseibium sp. CAU 1639]MCK7612766.1 hypothetical protein [Roseibium sp. CAU 1639]
MSRRIHSPAAATSGLKTGMRVTAVLAVSLALGACQSQFQKPSDLLFAPTFSKNRSDLPYTANTQYDCRAFTGNGWKGIASGRIHNFGQDYQLSQAGCFKSQNECQAWLMVMRGYIDVPRYMRCAPHSA